MIGIIAEFSFHEDQADEARTTLEDFVENETRVAGTVAYVMHVSSSDPTSVWFYELYDDVESLKEHMKGSRLREVLGGLRDAMREKPRIIELTPLAFSGPGARTLGGVDAG